MDEQGFLNAIRANPADDTARLVYADWLDERGDMRANLLRRECELIRLWAEVISLRQSVDEEWRTAVRPLARVVLHRYDPGRRIDIVKLARINQVGSTADLHGAVEAVEYLPRTICNMIPFEEAVRIASDFLSAGGVVSIEPANPTV